MGVPKFFYWLTKRYPCIYKTATSENCQYFDYFYIDLNSIIHQCSHGNISTNNNILSNQDRFLKISKYVDELYRFVKPKRMLILAVDGVAPVAKIAQQRQRRFKKVRDEERNEEFDSNAISPGTQFMLDLDDFLKKFIRHKVETDLSWNKIQIYYSGVGVPGEGEHKIMDFIRRSMKSEYYANGHHLIHGNDADLIILGLAMKLKNFCVFKEISDMSNTKIEKIIICVSLLRDYIDFEFRHLKDILPFEYDISKIIDDWVLMSFMVGNDFLPPLPFLYIHTNSLGLLWSVYKVVLPKMGGYIVENSRINFKNLNAYFNELVKYEKAHYKSKNIYDSWNSKKRFIKKDFNDLISTPFYFTCDEDYQMLCEVNDIVFPIPETQPGTMSEFGPPLQENNEIIELDTAEDNLSEDFLQFKGEYYLHKLNRILDYNAEQNFCSEYLRGLDWVLRYYLTGNPSWQWLYPYHYTPFVSDLLKHIPAEVNFEMGAPCNPLVQLVCIMPKESFSLLPSQFQTYLSDSNNEIIDMFPIYFETDINGKVQEYEAVVLIPFPRISKVTNIVDKLKLLMSPEDLEKYNFDKSYLFENKNHKILDCFEANIQKGKKNEYDCYITPTFYSLPHIAEFNVINFNNKICLLSNIILTNQNHTLADVVKVLSSEFYMDYPFSTPCISNEFYDFRYRYVLTITTDKKNININIHNEPLDSSQIKNLYDLNDLFVDRYFKQFSITLPSISYFVAARPLNGFTSKFRNNKLIISPSYSQNYVLIPYELCHPSKNGKFKRNKQAIDFSQLKDQLAISIDPENFGSVGAIESVDLEKNTAIINSLPEPILNISNMKFLSEPLYYSFYKYSSALEMVGLSKSAFDSIMGSIPIKNKSYYKDFGNIGLQLSNNQRTLEVFGYSKVSSDNYYFSYKALELVKDYLTNFPSLYQFIKVKSNNQRYTTDADLKLFDEKLIYYEMEQWLQENGVQNFVRSYKSCHYIDTNSVCELENLSFEYVKPARKNVSLRSLHLLGSSFNCEVWGSQIPKSLLDCVLCVHVDSSTPYLKYGIITGILDKSSIFNPKQMFYEVLFTETFDGGLKFRGNTNKSALVPSEWIINLSKSRNNYPSFLPKIWENILITGLFEPKHKSDDIFKNFIRQSFKKIDEASFKSDNFKPDILTKSTDDNTIIVQKVTRDQPVPYDVCDEASFLIKKLKDLCEQNYNTTPKIEIKSRGCKYVCFIRIGNHIFTGSWAETAYQSQINTTYVAYYTLRSIVNHHFGYSD